MHTTELMQTSLNVHKIRNEKIIKETNRTNKTKQTNKQINKVAFKKNKVNILVIKIVTAN